MAKYESPCQVLGLFAGAILVSCGVIYILTLEANKRYGDVSGRSFEAPEVSESQLIRNKRSLQFETEDDLDEDNAKWMTWSGDKDPNDFQDWKVDSEGNFYMDIPLADMKKKEEDGNFDNFETEEKEQVNSLEDKLDNYDDYDIKDDSKSATDLSENLLTEGLKHRKIRNIEEKIEFLKKDDQIVSEIVRQFCPKPSTTTIPPTTEAFGSSEDNYENYDCANKKCGEHCIKDWDTIGKCNINGECKTGSYPNTDLGCEEFNIIETNNDVGWQDVDNIFVFDEEPYEDEDNTSSNQQEEKQMNHMYDVPPLLVERNTNEDVHVPRAYINNEFESKKYPDRHSGIKCESESEILLTVAITTLVNFLFFGFIMIAKNWICDSYQFGKEFAEDTTPFVNNEEFNPEADFISCNCMDENCPNSRAAPYDRISVPYKRFSNEHDVASSMDVVGAAINSRASTPASSFYPNGLSVNSGDIVMALTYPPHRQFTSNPYEVERINNSTRFYNRNLMLQNDLPMQHHQNDEPTIHSSSSESNKKMEERLMISSVDSTPRMEEESKFTNDVNFLSDEGHIII